MTQFTIPGYRDLQLVGQGGLGSVYRAVRESTGGVVAIKELRDIAEASPAWHRARRELEAMLRLKGHPYVVSVEEIVAGPAGPCLVMEYVARGSLADRLHLGPLSVPEGVLVGQQVTNALMAAHQAGLVHRDVKPHNLLVGQYGQVKVCDFGIASLIRDGGVRTQTQALTLGYASPEALEGDVEIGPPADVYSFAATMAHLLSGAKPSLQDRMAGMRIELRTNDPAILPVAAALVRAMAADPRQRPTMPELHRLFEQAALDLGPRRLAALGDPDATVVRHAGVTLASAPGAVHMSPSQPIVPPGPMAATPIAVTATTPPTAIGVGADTTVIARAPHPGSVAPPPPAPGTPPPSPFPPVQPTSSRRTPAVAIAVSLVALAVVAVAAVVLFRGSGSDGASAGDQQDVDTSVDAASDPTTAATTATTAVPVVPAADTTVAPPPPTAPPTAPPTVAPTAPPETAPPAPAPVVTAAPASPPVIVNASASVVRDPSTDGCGAATNYQPSNIADGSFDTAWMAPGDGSGASVTFQFAQPSLIRSVGLVPGYDKFDPCTQTDRFFELRRITAVRWTFDDGSVIEQAVNPAPGMQYLDLGTTIVASQVTMTILDTVEPGLARLDHTPISEVAFR